MTMKQMMTMWTLEFSEQYLFVVAVVVVVVVEVVEFVIALDAEVWVEVEVESMKDDDDDDDVDDEHDEVNHLLQFLFHRLRQHEHTLEDDHQLSDHFDENLNNFHQEILQRKKNQRLK
ncbi:MAG: hypothetical protein JNN26_27585 [Candidatus Obscuribacter sp.]|nr:hypothetical protein [Candidatus Obscuribacter sp.]